MHSRICNPAGEYVGTPKDAVYDPDKLNEETIIKIIGESDGRCGTSQAAAGEFDGDFGGADIFTSRITELRECIGILSTISRYIVDDVELAPVGLLQLLSVDLKLVV